MLEVPTVCDCEVKVGLQKRVALADLHLHTELLLHVLLRDLAGHEVEVGTQQEGLESRSGLLFGPGGAHHNRNGGARHLPPLVAIEIRLGEGAPRGGALVADKQAALKSEVLRI